MKRKAVGIIVVLVLCMATTVFALKVRGQQKASTPPPREAIEHFMESPVYTGEEIVFEKEGVYSQSYPELHPISLNTNYVYWINDDGFIRFITEKQFVVPADSVLCGKEKASVIAKEWFDKVFFKEEQQFGKEVSIVTEDYDGGSYLVTVNLLLGGRQTGNSASLSISTDGHLSSAVFVQGILSRDDVLKEIKITETDAVELAKQALVTDGQEYYKDKTVIFHIDQVRDVQANCRTWKSHRFWEVRFTVPAEGILQEILDVYCTIQIDADTGECLEVATSAK